ncbi:YncE family protein [Burkholderia sp. Bp8963]|nr:YncE family protein [Burkholderia sp. Bp8963]
MRRQAPDESRFQSRHASLEVDMNRNAKYQRLTLPLGWVGVLLRAASREGLAQFKFGAVLRILAVLVLTMVSTAQDAIAQDHAFVANARSNTVSVIDRTTHAVVTTIAVGSVPVDLAVTPDRTQVYVANSGTNTVSIIATSSNTVVATVVVGSGPVSTAFTPDGRHAYVANSRANSVSVIDTATQKVVATVSVGVVPNKVVSTPDGASVYVTNAGDHTVSVIATATNAVSSTVPVGGNPFDVATPAAPTPASSCTDGMKNGQETGVDCGGPTCVPCNTGQMCLKGSDCQSSVCSPQGICQAPSCSDNIKNGLETDVDCGGGVCPTCAAGKMCKAGTDCASGICGMGICQP